nr:MAG: hypothetical protein [Enquatrovirus sp.]
MASRVVPKEVNKFMPEKLDFTGKALTQRNLDKKLSHQRERTYARTRAKVKAEYADKQLKDKKRINGEGFTEEKLKAPIDLQELYSKPEVALLDEAVIKKILPKGIGKASVKRVTEMINEAAQGMDSVMGEHIRDNCISWVDATKKATMSAEQYINAVKFVTFKLAGDTNVRAYTKTFPERVTRLAQEGHSNEYLSVYANAYAKGKIVTEVHALALVPTHLMYQDYFHLAVKTQVELMTDPNVSPKVRSDAANSLMTHLKTPEVKKAELNVSVNESDTIAELRDVLGQLSAKQHTDIIEGQYKVLDVSQHKIVSGDNEDDA